MSESAPAAKENSFFSRFLDVVERAGNRLPDPLTLFIGISLIIIILSMIFATLGVSVTHPVDGSEIKAVNLLAKENIRRMLVEMVKNFANFPPLGLVLVVMIGIGVAERSGLIAATLRKLVSLVPKPILPAALVFAGINASLAADAGYVVLVPLGAVLFMAFGRHPLAGLACAFAGVSAGFSANLVVTSLDPLLSGITTKAAQLAVPTYVVQATANYYFMVASVFLLTIVGSLVSTYIVEPRLGTWNRNNAEDLSGTELHDLKPQEKKGLWTSFWVLLVLLGIVLWLVLPAEAVLRDEHGLKPFYESVVTIIMIIFFVTGIAYGVVAGSIKNDKDVAKMTADTMATMGAYIVLAFVAAQFVAYFGWSNLGQILAITGAQTLKSIGFTGIPLLLGFLVVSGIANLLIGSASAKWALLGPVFVPMLMYMGISPELTQATYRVGDSVTNIICPLLPYLPVIIIFAKKYDKNMGLGTLFSTMLPYSIVFSIVWSLFLVIWYALGIPLGPDAPLTIDMTQFTASN